MEPEARYAVIFVSQRNGMDPAGYDAMAAQMESLARAQPGFVDLHSVRGPDGKGITISYWSSLPDVHQWGRNPEHLIAQRLGRDQWYASYQIAIAHIEVQRTFPSTSIPS